MAKETPDRKFRSNNFCLLLYLETESYDTKRVCDTISNMPDCRYAYAQHDKDTLPTGETKKPHIHVVIHFDNARYSTALADELGIPVQFVQKCKNWKKAVQYLIHQNNPEKYQYAADSISANYNFLTDLSADLNELQQAEQILNFLRDTDCCSTADLIHFAIQSGTYSCLRRNGSMFNSVVRENLNHRNRMIHDYNASIQRLKYDRCSFELFSDSIKQLTFEELEQMEKDQAKRLRAITQQMASARYLLDHNKLNDGIMCLPQYEKEVIDEK